MASASSTIDFGARVRLAITLFNADRISDCEREINTLLDYPELPRYFRIKCHIILAECQKDWHAAERETQIAENMWWNCRYLWPVETAHPSTNWLLDKLRDMLDRLKARLEEEGPLDYGDDGEEVRDDVVEDASGDQEMFAGTADAEEETS